MSCASCGGVDGHVDGCTFVGAVTNLAVRGLGVHEKLDAILEAVRALKPEPQYKIVPKDEEITSLREQLKWHMNELETCRADPQLLESYKRSLHKQDLELKQLRAENEAIRKSIGDGDYGPTAAELQRFREREPKVDAALCLLEGAADDGDAGYRNDLLQAIGAVRDFKVIP